MDSIPEKRDKRRLLYGSLVFLISILLTLPWLGLGNFYTRGEPREAIVAMAMLDQGNFILPMFQEEFAFKPPMLHWLVALFSSPQGYISEYTARMPSALASIALSLGFFLFLSRRFDERKVFIASLLLMSCFEVHRAAMTCRVDMVLTAFMAGSMMALYRWSEKGYRGFPWTAAILASGAILTKGPIGAILPCFALFVWMAFEKERWQRIVLALLKTAFLSSLLPLCWYVAAYKVGGDDFLRLVMEENFGRFLGKMTYESHENGISYNFLTLLSGMLPWTLLLVLGLVAFKWKQLKTGTEWLRGRWQSFKAMDSISRYALIAAICIFVFYCIPKSKRSVYLLPMYPFLSLWAAHWMVEAYRNRRKALKWFACFMAMIGIVASCAMLILPFIPLDWIGTSRSALRLISQLSELQRLPMGLYYVVLSSLPVLAAVWLFFKKESAKSWLTVPIATWITMMFTLDGLLNPAIKNSVPDFQFAQSLKVLQPDGKVYFYRPAGTAEETIYTVAFYLDNHPVTYREGDTLPIHGYMMLRESNADRLQNTFKGEGYDIHEILRTTTPFSSCRQTILLYEFNKHHPKYEN